MYASVSQCFTDSARYSSVFRRRKSPAASLIRENSIQNACTSMKRSCQSRQVRTKTRDDQTIHTNSIPVLFDFKPRINKHGTLACMVWICIFFFFRAACLPTPSGTSAALLGKAEGVPAHPTSSFHFHYRHQDERRGILYTQQTIPRRRLGNTDTITHLDIDDLIPDERLQEHAHQPNQSVLHVLVFDVLAARDAI